MQDKKSFGKYILKKRKEANLTQEELASKLYVIPTTISKWERGITYPDITMITNLCEALNISEHEFFTACDDFVFRDEKKEIEKFRKVKKGILYFLNIGYVLGILTCFICNLVIEHRLSWFFIVFVGIGISFSLTTLPFYLKKDKMRWLKVTAIFSLFIYGLLFVIHNVVGGKWFLGSVFVATYVLIVLWILVLVSIFSKIDCYDKVALGFLLMAILTATMNPFCNFLFSLSNEDTHIPNIISSFILIVLSIIFALIPYFQKHHTN